MFHIHKWTKWEQFVHSVFRYGRWVPGVAAQKRHCLKCNKLQITDV